MSTLKSQTYLTGAHEDNCLPKQNQVAQIEIAFPRLTSLGCRSSEMGRILGKRGLQVGFHMTKDGMEVQGESSDQNRDAICT